MKISSDSIKTLKTFLENTQFINGTCPHLMKNLGYENGNILDWMKSMYYGVRFGVPSEKACPDDPFYSWIDGGRIFISIPKQFYNEYRVYVSYNNKYFKSWMSYHHVDLDIKKEIKKAFLDIKDNKDFHDTIYICRRYEDS